MTRRARAFYLLKNDLKQLGHPTYIRLSKIRFHSSNVYKDYPHQQRPQIQTSMTTCPCKIAQSPHLSTVCSPHVQWTVSVVHLRLKSQSGERSAPKVMSATMAWKSTITWKRIAYKLTSWGRRFSYHLLLHQRRTCMSWMSGMSAVLW